MVSGLSSTRSYGEKPNSNAVAKTNGLNADPVCRRACVARLKPPVALTLVPPTMARTAPSGDMTTTAACASDPSLTLFSKIKRQLLFPHPEYQDRGLFG